jgi:hypothetical protein
MYKIYYNHRTSYFCKLIAIYILFYFIYKNIVTKFQHRENEHNHGLLWVKDALMYEVHTNEKIEWFINKFISCDISLLLNPLLNAQQHQHTCTCKKKDVLCKFHYPLSPMRETKIL